jgi:hypothetical protein
MTYLLWVFLRNRDTSITRVDQLLTIIRFGFREYWLILLRQYSLLSSGKRKCDLEDVGPLLFLEAGYRLEEYRRALDDFITARHDQNVIAPICFGLLGAFLVGRQNKFPSDRVQKRAVYLQKMFRLSTAQ